MCLWVCCCIWYINLIKVGSSGWRPQLCTMKDVNTNSAQHKLGTLGKAMATTTSSNLTTLKAVNLNSNKQRRRRAGCLWKETIYTHLYQHIKLNRVDKCMRVFRWSHRSYQVFTTALLHQREGYHKNQRVSVCDWAWVRERERESTGMWKPCRGNNLSHITEPTEVCGSGELSNKIQLTTKGSLKK